MKIRISLERLAKIEKQLKNIVANVAFVSATSGILTLADVRLAKTIFSVAIVSLAITLIILDIVLVIELALAIERR